MRISTVNKEIFEYIIEGYFVLKGTSRRVTTEEIIELYEILKQVDNEQPTVLGPNVAFPSYPVHPKYGDTPMRVDCEPWSGGDYNKWGQYVCPSSVRINCNEMS